MKILVFGSKGFIGSHLVEYFQLRNYSVWGCDIVNDYNDLNYIQIDALNSDFHSIFEKHEFDICVNCSGAASVPLSLQYPLKDFNLNTYNVFKILDAIRQYAPDCKFINLSSAAVYGNPKELPIKESFESHPISPYGIHKMQAEQICTEFYKFYNIRTCSLRLFSAYGEGLKKQLFWDLFQKQKLSSTISLFGTGNETRDFIYIDDIAEAIICIMKNAIFEAEKINIANGEECKIADIANLFLKTINQNNVIVFNNEVKEGDPQNWCADIDLLKQMGYRKSISIEQGIERLSQWLRENG